MIFTTFTVIFLPLSFFTGLFGMNTAEWGGGDNLRLSTIGSVALPASALVIGGALAGAFSWRVQRATRAVGRAGLALLDAARRGAARLEPAGRSERKARRRLARQEAERRARRQRDRGYDFWDTVRRQRASEYRIPELNRRDDAPPAVTPRSTWRSRRPKKEEESDDE